jgi:hypothetical protein
VLRFWDPFRAPKSGDVGFSSGKVGLVFFIFPWWGVARKGSWMCVGELPVGGERDLSEGSDGVYERLFKEADVVVIATVKETGVDCMGHGWAWRGWHFVAKKQSIKEAKGMG